MLSFCSRVPESGPAFACVALRTSRRCRCLSMHHTLNRNRTNARCTPRAAAGALSRFARLATSGAWPKSPRLLPAHKSPRPFVRCKNAHRKWPGCLVKFFPKIPKCPGTFGFCSTPESRGQPCGGKGFAWAATKLPLFSPVMAESALGVGRRYYSTRPTGHWALRHIHQKSGQVKPLLFNAASSGFV